MQSDQIKLPVGAQRIINTLHADGYEAYVVGGCVRDSLLGLEPKDWDICTNALPEQIMGSFAGEKIAETGLKHGTLTIVLADQSYEVTTFRTDGEYSDHRRPDNVEFCSDIKQDLARRDFTINAMAYSPKTGLIDPFSGQHDLELGLIRCVGDPEERFKEDALRILRAIRFSSTYGFTISLGTSFALRRRKDDLQFIAKERIREELCKTLMGIGSFEPLFMYSDVIAVVIPEIEPCIGFRQNNRYHCYTVFTHILHAVSAYGGDDLTVKLALFLHDIGKPWCYSEDERGGHFYGHGEESRDIAEGILERLRFDNKTKNDVLELIFWHEAEILPTQRSVRKWLNRIGVEQFIRLLDLRMADISAHAPGTQEKHRAECIATRQTLKKIIEEQQCFKLKDLHINGDDIINLGVLQGKEVGEILRWLLDEVIAGNIENKHHDLMAAADMEIYRRSGNDRG